jgi:hypothetical protein
MKKVPIEDIYGTLEEHPHHARAQQGCGEITFKDLGFTIITGTGYLGGFIGEAPNQQLWIQEKTEIRRQPMQDFKSLCNRNGSSCNV